VVIPRGDAVALARALIQIDSRNPTLAPDSPGEADCARTLAAVLDDWGFAVQLIDAMPGRPNVVPVTAGRDSRLVLGAAIMAALVVAAGVALLRGRHAPVEPESSPAEAA